MHDTAFLCESIYFTVQLEDHSQTFILRNQVKSSLTSLQIFPMSPVPFYLWEWLNKKTEEIIHSVFWSPVVLVLSLNKYARLCPASSEQTEALLLVTTDSLWLLIYLPSVTMVFFHLIDNRCPSTLHLLANDNLLLYILRIFSVLLLVQFMCVILFEFVVHQLVANYLFVTGDNNILYTHQPCIFKKPFTRTSLCCFEYGVPEAPSEYWL